MSNAQMLFIIGNLWLATACHQRVFGTAWGMAWLFFVASAIARILNSN